VPRSHYLHVLAAAGAFSDDAAFHPLAAWDGDEIMPLFHERLLARLVEEHALSQDLATKLSSCRGTGFSAHVGEAMPSDDPRAIKDLAGYVVRNPLSLRRLVYLDGQQAALI
jgi:hypothetical protein